MSELEKRHESIFQERKRLKEEAKELAEKFKDKKVTKYLIKK
jgi:hypothetical protein